MKTGHLRFLATAIATLTFSIHAHATVWNIDSVLHGSDGGFGYSVFHTASGSNVMSGSVLGDITNVISGTYDDTTGAFSATFEVDPVGSANTTFTLNGNLLFSSNFLATPSTLAIDFAVPNTHLVDTVLGFVPGDICCSGNTNTTPGLDPNSFDASAGIISLWGANGFLANATGSRVADYYYDSTLGMDLRLQLSPTSVPEPSTLALLGLGIAAIGVARRRSAKSAR